MTGNESEVGFAVIGTGLVGPTHAIAAAHARGGRLIVVCDRVPERAEAVAEKLGVEWTTDVDAVLARADVQCGQHLPANTAAPRSCRTSCQSGEASDY